MTDKQYTVTWSYDTRAANPEEAARLASKVMLLNGDPKRAGWGLHGGHTEVVVECSDGTTHDVDLAKLATLPRRPTRTEIGARMRDKRFQITGKIPGRVKAPCLVCERVDTHVDGGGSHYTCSGMVGDTEHLYFYCTGGGGCSGAKSTVSPLYNEPDYLGDLDEEHGLFVVWRCPCDSLLPRQGWKPSMGDDCPEYGSAYDCVGDVCHVCHRKRSNPKRPRAGRAD